MTTPSPFLDVPPFPADRYAPLADRIKALLSTRNDIVFVQAEAILALEAAATSLGRPGLKALNVVTSPYGGYFGRWLQRAGADVVTVDAEAGRPITASVVEAALAAHPDVALIAVVHAETSSGILNPLPQIAVLAQACNALLVVDAVASVGGHPLDGDGLGIDVCVVGAQKALAGPAGLSMLSVSARAWAAMQPQPAPSSLSLLDLRANWLDKGRAVLPGMPSALEFWALDAALDRVEAETLPAVIARHAWAARATRQGLRLIGAELWVERDEEASTLATAVQVPEERAAGIVAEGRALGAALSPGFGVIASRIVRLEHTGQKASRTGVVAGLTAFAAAVGSNTPAPALADLVFSTWPQV